MSTEAPPDSPLVIALDRALDAIRAAYKLADGPLATFRPGITRAGKDLAALREDAIAVTKPKAAP